jgi:hypothetical protein
LTQREVARQANTILKKFDQAAREKKFKSYEDILNNYERSYQRLEQKGDTSKKMAAALAQVFKTTVEILQGGAPEAEDSFSLIDRIEQQLREQKKLGSNLALQHALVQHVETYSETTNEDDCMRDFAEDIGTQIEVAQIGQNPSEIARLAKLTGWSADQLQQPGGVHGHWLLLTMVYGSRETEIVLGASVVMHKIRETVEKYMKWARSDIRITLRRLLPWFHVEITDPCIPARRLKFSFVRCRPEVSGLKWVNPTWRDQFLLEEPLEKWAFSACFESQDMP